MKSYSDNIHNLIYNVDASHLFSNEEVEVFIPETKSEAKEIVEKAIKENKKVICRWWWTNLVWNCLPLKDSIIIDTSKLNSIIEKWEHYVAVEPWINSDALNKEISIDNHFFPVVLWSHAWALIWWMIATNWAWMRAIKYWKMEDRVEELEVLVVNKDKKSEIIRLVWDECKDFLWSEWRLWIVLEAKLKIIKKPESKSIQIKMFEELQEALSFVNEVKVSNNQNLSALEIINPVTAELIEGKKLYYVLVEYEDSSTWTIKDEKQIKEAWSKRDACYAVCVNAWYDQIEDPKIPEDKFEEFFKWFEDKNLPVFWHIGIWVLHPHFKEWQEDLIEEMYKFVQKLWWEVSWEHWIGRKKQSYVSEEYINDTKKLKEKRDNNNVFWY